MCLHRQRRALGVLRARVVAVGGGGERHCDLIVVRDEGTSAYGVPRRPDQTDGLLPQTTSRIYTILTYARPIPSQNYSQVWATDDGGLGVPMGKLSDGRRVRNPPLRSV